jgi:dihydropyrimidinase
MSVLIKGGRVITAADDYVADVFIEDERISLIGESLDVPADKVIDASGKYVLPGLVDPHTHLEMPWRGETTVDDFQSGHTAAAFGGTTTHVDFCIQGKGQTFGEALEAWHAKREGKALIDNGFHIAVTDLREGGTLEELAELPEKHGVTSYKLFMAYKDSLMVDDETLFRTMQVAAETGALVMVHAENGDAIEVLVAEALAAGNTDPIYHALTRPPETEGEATNRAIQLARVAGAALYVVHVSCAESVEPLAIAREKGWNVHGETCTQYFFIDQTFLERPNFEGAKYVYTPPPRDKANQEVLWNAVRTDVLSAISTDHCAYLFEGQKDAGKDDFSQIPNGGPGLENRLHMIHEFGVRTGRISLNRMVELLATNPAKLFGLYPRKGTLAVGSDGDIVVFDPEKRLTISASTHHSASDYNLYEGTEVTGSPEVVLLRGHVLVENGELVAKPGTGQFIKRARFGEELKPAALAAVSG